MEPNKQVCRILIADNSPLFRQGLQTIMSAEPDIDILEEASQMDEALAKVRALRPDVLVMDLDLVDEAGHEMTSAIRQAHPGMAILFLTRDDRTAKLEAALAAGARGYMLRDSSPAHYLAAVRRAAHGEQDVSPESLSRHLTDLQALTRTHDAFPRASLLTPRELEVMKLLAARHTVREVAGFLQLSIKTVEAHKLNLMRKLDIHNRTALMNYAIQRGIVAPPVPV